MADAHDTSSTSLLQIRPTFLPFSSCFIYEKALVSNTLKRNDVCVRRGNESGRYTGNIRGVAMILERIGGDLASKSDLSTVNMTKTLVVPRARRDDPSDH